MEYQNGKVAIAMWPDFTKADVESVINNLRETDLYEGAAIGETAEDRVVTCRNTVASTPLSWMVYLEGRPVFMFGLVALTPHHSVLWGFGTEETEKAIRAVTRYVRREWLAEMARAGIRRIEARLPSACLGSRSWLNSCGMDHEAELMGVSTTGEPFSQLAWVRKD